MKYCQGQITKKWALGRRIICLVEDHSRNISMEVLAKHLQKFNNNAILLFSHYMATLSFHSNQSFWAKAIENLKFVEAKTKIISAKSQSYIPCGFWGNDFFFYFWHFGCHGNKSKWALGRKIICLKEDHSRDISVKVLSKYLQWLNNKCHFSIFQLKVYGNFKSR